MARSIRLAGSYGRWAVTRRAFSTSLPCKSSSHSDSSSVSNSDRHDPLVVSVPTDALGLPTPQPPSITAFEPTPISRALLQRLHGLAALNPPPEGSAEEDALRHDLGDLVGLMDLVHEVEVGDVGELLSSTGEVVFDAAAVKGRGDAELGEGEGRALLGYATRRVGDFYGFKATIKGEDEG